MKAREAKEMAGIAVSLSLKKVLKSIGEEAAKGKYFYQIDFELTQEQRRYLEDIGYAVNTDYRFITTILW